jgi:predicted heme/steroid binding protein
MSFRIKAFLRQFHVIVSENDFADNGITFLRTFRSGYKRRLIKMTRNKKIMAAGLALILGTFALAGCTTGEATGVTGDSAVAAEEQAPAEEKVEDATSSVTNKSDEGEDAVSSATGGKVNPGEKDPKGERGARPEVDTTTEQTIPDKTFTLEELSKFDGKDGAAAYIAIDGVVYNVTDADGWNEGEHEGYYAGQDLTAAFEASPHKDSMLSGLEIMGKLAE